MTAFRTSWREAFLFDRIKEGVARDTVKTKWE